MLPVSVRDAFFGDHNRSLDESFLVSTVKRISPSVDTDVEDVFEVLVTDVTIRSVQLHQVVDPRNPSRGFFLRVETSVNFLTPNGSVSAWAHATEPMEFFFGLTLSVL